MTNPCKRCNGSGVEPDLQQIGADLRKKRKALGWSLRYVADLAGCSLSYVCDIEHGRRSLIGEKARAIAEAVDA